MFEEAVLMGGFFFLFCCEGLYQLFLRDVPSRTLEMYLSVH